MRQIARKCMDLSRVTTSTAKWWWYGNTDFKVRWSDEMGRCGNDANEREMFQWHINALRAKRVSAQHIRSVQAKDELSWCNSSAELAQTLLQQANVRSLKSHHPSRCANSWLTLQIPNPACDSHQEGSGSRYIFISSASSPSAPRAENMRIYTAYNDAYAKGEGRRILRTWFGDDSRAAIRDDVNSDEMTKHPSPPLEAYPALLTAEFVTALQSRTLPRPLLWCEGAFVNTNTWSALK